MGEERSDERMLERSDSEGVIPPSCITNNLPLFASLLAAIAGAPELNATFRHIVKGARRLRPELDIIDRCNLTVVHEPGQEDLIDFLVEHR